MAKEEEPKPQNVLGDVLRHAGFPAGLFVWLGAVLFLVALFGHPRYIAAGFSVVFLGISWYYGGRARGYIGYGGEPGESFFELVPTALAAVFFLLFLLCLYLFLSPSAQLRLLSLFK